MSAVLGREEPLSDLFEETEKAHDASAMDRVEAEQTETTEEAVRTEGEVEEEDDWMALAS